MNDVEKRIKAKTNKVVRQVRCLADDAAFNTALSNNPPLAKAILVPILGRSDFEVKKAKTQFVVGGHGGHGVRFDCLLRFDDGTYCDLEMQKCAGEMNKERVMAYQDSLGKLTLKAGMDYKRRKPTLLVIINNGDIMEDNLPLYEIRPVVLQTGKVFYDKSAIYIANLKHKDGSTELGRLMTDLECEEPEKMHFAPLRKGLEMVKSKGGKNMMGRQMEKICKEFREEGREEGATEMLVKLARNGRLTVEAAAEELGVSVESFRELMADNA